MMEALVCHPLGKSNNSRIYLGKCSGSDKSLDTIKVRMQLSRRARAPGVRRSPFLLSK